MVLLHNHRQSVLQRLTRLCHNSCGLACKGNLEPEKDTHTHTHFNLPPSRSNKTLNIMQRNNSAASNSSSKTSLIRYATQMMTKILSVPSASLNCVALTQRLPSTIVRSECWGCENLLGCQRQKKKRKWGKWHSRLTQTSPWAPERPADLWVRSSPGPAIRVAVETEQCIRQREIKVMSASAADTLK